EFRKMPDALERAAELDKQYGRDPDLNKLPMYCSVISLKDWYEAKDMRATSGNDVNSAMDVPKVDSPDIAMLRSKGAIVYAVATAESVGGPSAQGATKVSKVFPLGDLHSHWGGQPCNPYDTARVPRGTSNGSGVSVAANLATCSICEQSSASCKGPASRNNVVNLLPTKGVHMDVGISDQLDKEIKTVLRDKLGAEIVESIDPLYPDDPSVPKMTYTFQDAFAEILPHEVPEYFFTKSKTGELAFAVPGWDVTTSD